MLCGFDLSASSTGWCYGNGKHIPKAGAWLYEGVGDDHGILASRFRRDVIGLFDRISPTGIMFERPILRPHDRVGPLRKVYGLGFVLEEICYVRGIPVRDQTLQALKKRLTGNHKAPKEEMIAAALEHGLTLPATYSKGRKDAADAFAAWLWAVEDFAPGPLVTLATDPQWGIALVFESAEQPLPGTTPRPLAEHQRGECSYVLDPATQLVCCAPATGPYCPGHHKLIYRTEPRANLERSLRKYLHK